MTLNAELENYIYPHLSQLMPGFLLIAQLVGPVRLVDCPILDLYAILFRIEIGNNLRAFRALRNFMVSLPLHWSIPASTFTGTAYLLSRPWSPRIIQLVLSL